MRSGRRPFLFLLFLLTLLSLFFIVSCGSSSAKVEESIIVDETFRYRSVSETDAFLEAVAERNPAIAKTVVFGTSENGREIKAILISSNPNEEAIGSKPSVRIVAAIHGNEKISSEVALRLIDYITSNYTSLPRVRTLVDDTLLCIVPILNPDGYEANTRYNANGKDLNRDFVNYRVLCEEGHLNATDLYRTRTDYRSGNTSTTTFTDYYISKTDLFTQAESRAVKAFHANDFDISISLHAGDVIVNTLFDFTAWCEPRNFESIYTLCRSYADTSNTDTGDVFSLHARNRMFSENGVVRGYWMYEFAVYGTLQDWSYIETGCVDTTVEVSLNKEPVKKSDIEEIFGYNRDSIIAYAQLAAWYKSLGIIPGFVF